MLKKRNQNKRCQSIFYGCVISKKIDKFIVYNFQRIVSKQFEYIQIKLLSVFIHPGVFLLEKKDINICTRNIFSHQKSIFVFQTEKFVDWC